MSRPLTDEELFASALRIQTANDRLAYLEQACAGNLEQLARVKSLLAALDDAGSFLNKPVADLGALGATVTPDPNAAHAAAGAPSSDIPLDFLTPAESPDALGKLGPYIVEDVIGRGGMGIVLRAVDPKLNRVVAIKVLAPELARSPMAGKRFLREAQAAAAVSHDHVVRIYAVEDTGPVPYLVMECIVGQSLQQKIERKGILEIREILRIGCQMAAGLTAAHKQGLVHRDIKPANILLENGIERVKITDFGLARASDDVGMTQTGQVTGTPQYMSPEQAMGEQVDHRSDLFSLGSVLYTMCTGRPAFRATSTVAVLKRVVDDAPRPIRELNAEAPDWLIGIIDKLMEKRPADRFQSAAEVASVLEQWLAHYQRPQTVPAPMFAGPTAKTSAAPAAKGTLRRAWDEWWSERDRWFAISVQTVLVILHLICMLAFLNFYSSRTFQKDKPQYTFLMGSPWPWYRFEMNQGDKFGFSSGFYPFTWSVVLGLIGWALYYVVWRIEKARDPKTSGWNRPEVLMSFWGVLAFCGVTFGTVVGYGLVASSHSVAKSSSPMGQVPELHSNVAKKIEAFNSAKLKPTLPPWAGDDASVKFQDGAWRIENNTDHGNFNVLMGTLLEHIPTQGTIICRAQIKMEVKDSLTRGAVQLGLADGLLSGRDQGPEKHTWPDSEYEFQGNITEWTQREFRSPAAVFHSKNPPQMQVYVGLNNNGIVWVKDLELLHLPHSTSTPPLAKSPIDANRETTTQPLVSRVGPPKSAAVLAELRKQVELFEEELKVAKAQREAQTAPLYDVIQAEFAWHEAKFNLAVAEADRPASVSTAREMVDLAEKMVEIIRTNAEAGNQSLQAQRNAEKVLSDAKVRLAELNPDDLESPKLEE